jgi:putative acetyltransferase
MIREYRPADCPAVLHIWERASAVAHPFLTREFMDEERERIADEFLPRADTWVYDVSGGVAAFMSLFQSDVGALFVEPALHRRGIGRALIGHARAVRGALDVEVFERNVLGRAFYEQMGFAFVGLRRDVATGLDVVQLHLP